MKYLSCVLLLLSYTVCLAVTPKQNYLLEIPMPIIPQTTVGHQSLLVTMPQSAPGFDTTDQIYMRHENILEHYTKSQWVETPARMLLPFLVLYMEATGQFKAVLSAVTIPIAADLRLDTEIIRLYQKFFTEPSQLLLILRVQLLDMTQRQVIATRLFEIKKEAGLDVQGAVVATNEAMAEFLNELAIFVKKELNQ